MNKITGTGITKTYGTNDVLQDVSLELESGRIYGLIGRNGAGKTTLLSILSAQNPATRGTVTLDGETVWENPQALSHLCFSRELNPTSGNGMTAMKVKEYLEIASVFYPHWDREMAKRLVEEFHLDVKKRMAKLSKGMLSMVTIVVALASCADFTFLDEPVAGLDIVAREKFYRLLVEEFNETGRTFVVSTHIIEEASDIFEEVIIVDQGRIYLKENTQELLERCVHVSGREEDVDAVTAGLEKHQEEHLGRSKGVTVMLKPGQRLAAGYDVTVQRLSLQKLFAALCGEEERHE